jgi:hypothetical protein
MSADVVMAGYRLTEDEWAALDDEARAELIEVLLFHQRYDRSAYASFELSFDRSRRR